MTPADLAKFELQPRYATLVALAIEGHGHIDLHDRIMGKLFSAAKNKHQQQFQASGKAINDKVRLYGRIGQALLEAKQSGSDPFAAIESILSWDAFTTSVGEAQKLAMMRVSTARCRLIDEGEASSYPVPAGMPCNACGLVK